ncbi:MAG TPA: sugar phosphate isomerase/epimerase family protein [Rectinemataceae bacterium]|nr:sugar phosphate isomerase/epimerase family protein [Rectinemataceae bacterium]
MIRGLTRTGVGEVGNDENFIALAARYGFSSVDLDPSGLIQEQGIEGARRILSGNGIRLGSILLPVEWRFDEERFRQDLVPLAGRLDAAAKLGAASFWTYLLPSVDEDPVTFLGTATRRLRLCAELLEAFGFRLALEFLGPRDLRGRWKHPLMWNMGQTLAWIGAIDRPNVGLLLDSFHWHTAGHNLDDLLRLRASDLVHVHLGDAPDTARELLPDDDRLYPGEGAIDLRSFLSGLKSIGYQGIVAQEVLSPRPPTLPAEELLERSKKGFDKLFAALELD